MHTSVTGSDTNRELHRLYKEHMEASMEAFDLLSRRGFDSPEFIETNTLLRALWRRIEQITGNTDRVADTARPQSLAP